MSTEYTELCYERAILAHLINHLTTKCVAPRGEIPEEDIQCEDLPFHSRRVSRESVFKLNRRLTSEFERVDREIAKFAMVRETPKPLAPDPEEKKDEQQPEPQSAQDDGKEKKRRSRKAG